MEMQTFEELKILVNKKIDYCNKSLQPLDCIMQILYYNNRGAF